MILKGSILVTLLLAVLLMRSQDCYNYDHHTHPEDTTHEVKSVKEFFTGGQVEGHMRNYFMATINQGDLTDYWANGTGGAIAYHTDIWKGWQFGVSGIFSFNTASSDLNALDTAAGRSAKWEKELFDVNRPDEKRDLDRLEELYVKYYFGHSFVTYGKIDLNDGPLLLKRDGRMKPFAFKGFWGEINELEKYKFTLGWIHAVSPRGMTEWYTLSEAIGLSNNGCQPNGDHADYQHHTATNGLGVFGIHRSVGNHLKVKAYNYYLHRFFNLNWLQLDYSKHHFFGGLQYVHQFADPYQSKITYVERYYQPDEQANVLSGVAGWQSNNKKLKFSGAYLHGFGTGRFLFPKELTREGFYVSQPRSWAEGFGKVDIVSLRAELRFDKAGWSNWSFDTRFQSVMTTGATDFANNKYGTSSYYQTTVLVNYSPKKILTGVHFTLMYVGRMTPNSEDFTPDRVFYKTNLHHFNFITNIYF
jgi:hypothetical protein